jgi:hypothetical protein
MSLVERGEPCPRSRSFSIRARKFLEPHFSSEMGHVPVRIRKIDFFEVKK